MWTSFFQNIFSHLVLWWWWRSICIYYISSLISSCFLAFCHLSVCLVSCKAFFNQQILLHSLKWIIISFLSVKYWAILAPRNRVLVSLYTEWVYLSFQLNLNQAQTHAVLCIFVESTPTISACGILPTHDLTSKNFYFWSTFLFSFK